MSESTKEEISSESSSDELDSEQSSHQRRETTTTQEAVERVNVGEEAVNNKEEDENSNHGSNEHLAFISTTATIADEESIPLLLGSSRSSMTEDIMNDIRGYFSQMKYWLSTVFKPQVKFVPSINASLTLFLIYGSLLLFWSHVSSKYGAPVVNKFKSGTSNSSSNWENETELPSVSPMIDHTIFSAALALPHLKAITTQSHMYNSIANDHVRQYLIHSLYALKSQIVLDDSHILEKNSSLIMYIIDNDLINITSVYGQDHKYAVWFESNSILVRLSFNGGKAGTKALLVSSHFDSVSSSKGSTDAGISIAVMLETIRALITTNEPLSHDVIFAFTNGEEMYLQGSTAFLHHPWMKDVLAFVNLEGTGAAKNSKSVLFRTNSLRLAQDYARGGAAWPHASVILNDAMSFINSETDFRRYAMKAPGLDIAFYANRFYYHTYLDDVPFTSEEAIQHMGDNTLSLVRKLTQKGVMEKAVQSFVPLKNPEADIPTSGFVYHDVLGVSMTVTSHGVYLALTTAMILSLPFVSLIFYGYSWIKSGSRMGDFIRKKVCPSIYSFFIVIWCLCFAILLSMTASWVGSLFSPHRAYYKFDSSLFIILWSCYAGICLAYYFRPSFLTFIWPIYAHGSSNSHYTQHDSLMNDDDDLIQESRYYTYPNNMYQQQQQLNEVRKLDDLLLEKNIHLGLLGFWYSMALVALWIGLHRYDSGYLLIYWSGSFVAACSLKLVFDAIQHLNSDDDDNLLNPTPRSMSRKFVLEIYQHDHILLFIFSSAFPILLTLDVLWILIEAFPSMIAENISSWQVEFIFSIFISIMLINSILLFKNANACVVLLLVFTMFYPSHMIPSKPTPIAKFRWSDITDETFMTTPIDVESRLEVGFIHPDQVPLNLLQSNLSRKMECSSESCIFYGSPRPRLPLGSLSFTYKLETVSNYKNLTQQNYILNGQFFGSPGSRICQIQVWNQNNATINFDTNSPSIWTRFHSQSIHNVSKAILTRRNVDKSSRRINSTFSIEGITNLPMNVTLTCYHDEDEVSKSYLSIIELAKKSRVFPLGTKYGAVEIRKSFNISL